MRGLEPIADYAKAALAKRGAWPAGIELVARADLDMAGQYAEVWVTVSKEKIQVFTGPEVTESHRGKKEKPNHTEPAVPWSVTDYKEFDLTKVEECRFESMTGGGILVLTISGDESVVCRFTNSMGRKFGKLCKLIEKMSKGKELEDSDLEEEGINAVCPKCGRPYPEPDRKVCPKCLDKRSIFIRVLSFVPRYKKQISLILLCMLGSSALALTSPYLGGRVLFDQALKEGGKYEGKIGIVVLLTLCVQLLSLVLSIAYGRINSAMTAEVVYDLKTGVFSALQRLSMKFFNGKQTGNLMNRVNYDANQLQYFFHDGLPYFVVNCISIIGISAMMISMNWHLAIFVLIPAPVIVWCVNKLFPKLWTIFNRRWRRSSALNALVNDTLTGMRVVKAFGKEQAEIQRFARRNRDVYDISLQAGNLSSSIFPFLGFLMGLGGLVVWSVGGWDVVNGRLTFGTLMTFIGYLGMLYGPLEFMTNIVDWWTGCMNSAQRIFEILDAVPDVADAPDATHIDRISGDVVLKNVTFGYEPNKPVLKDINFEVKAGEMIGLVGHSGAGKSTITNLITRLYDVDEGLITIDGIDVRQIKQKDLRNQIGMVLQETYLFAGTIFENIAYAKHDASPAEVIEAAKIANAHDFIMKLPDGYDTVIGRRGQNLSGGERQRIAIARAVLLDPRILILDEATASLDTETERQIQEALERLVKGRTTFAIAHRLSTLRNADRLVVIENGKVVEIGTHEEVIRAKGVYFKLYQKQMEALKIRGIDV